MNDPLRGCPTCGTKTEKANLGLRDYRWLGDSLPGRVAPMDVDFMLERNGQFLVIENKPGGAPIPMGQRITLKALVRQGMDVWVAWEQEDGKHVEVGVMDKHGNVNFIDRMTVAKLKNKVSEWFSAATKGE
jgi:hypothetical protein